jgi:hypothetical protein
MSESRSGEFRQMFMLGNSLFGQATHANAVFERAHMHLGRVDKPIDARIAN